MTPLTPPFPAAASEDAAAFADVDTSPPVLARYRFLAPDARKRVLLALVVRDHLTPAAIAKAVGMHPATIGRQLAKAGLHSAATDQPPPPSHTPRHRVPREQVRVAQERVHEVLLPLPRDARAEVLSWAYSTLAAR